MSADPAAFVASLPRSGHRSALERPEVRAAIDRLIAYSQSVGRHNLPATAVRTFVRLDTGKIVGRDKLAEYLEQLPAWRALKGLDS